MTEKNSGDLGLLAMIQRALRVGAPDEPKEPAKPAEHPPAEPEQPIYAIEEAAETPGAIGETVVQEPDPPDVEPSKPGQKHLRTAEELSDIITKALRSLEGFPEQGFVVTVYGANPWNAMLSFTTEAGRVKNPELWRERVKIMAVRLRQDFDVAG